MATAEKRGGLRRSVPHLEADHQGDCQATSTLFQHNIPHLSQTGYCTMLSFQISSILVRWALLCHRYLFSSGFTILDPEPLEVLANKYSCI